MLTIRDAVYDDLPGMMAIYNEAIRNLNATFDLEEKTLEERQKWFEAHGGRYPLIVAELNGEVAGYCCLSPFNPKPAYDNTAELSVYISSNHRGNGIGTALMRDILQRAEQIHFHSLISIIAEGNTASVKLHEKFGFSCVGHLREVGWKFGRWHDVFYYQYMFKNQLQ